MSDYMKSQGYIEFEYILPEYQSHREMIDIQDGRMIAGEDDPDSSTFKKFQEMRNNNLLGSMKIRELKHTAILDDMYTARKQHLTVMKAFTPSMYMALTFQTRNLRKSTFMTFSPGRMKTI